MSSHDIYLTDMTRCLPADALSATPAIGKWQVVDYNAGEIAGRMLFAYPLYETPEITLPLRLTGWHALSIGFWPPIEQEHGTLIKHRLSQEDVFTIFTHPRQWAPQSGFDKTELLETLPRYVDLTGQDLVLGKSNTAYPPALACIAYVRLTPLSAEEVDAIRRDRARRDTRNVVAMVDGHSFCHRLCPSTKEQLLEIVEPYRHSDVGKVLWGVNGGDLTYYPSQVGKYYLVEDEVYPSLGHQHARQSHKAMAQRGVIPFQAALERAHALGLEFHTYHRPAILDRAQPYSYTQTTFLRNYPECRIVAKDGTPLPKASFAFPQVRDFMVSLIEEAMQHDIDGVNLCFIRGPEYVGYEGPVVEDFMKLAGRDPRQVDGDDEVLAQLRAGYLTDFMRAVRRSADRHGRRRGREIQVSAVFEGGKENMRYLGYDCYTWIKEGLVNFVITSAPSDLIRLAKAHGCQVYMGPSIPWWGPDPAERAVTAMRHAYASEMDGVAIWDIDQGQLNPELWAVYGRLGHREEIADFREPAKYPRMKRLKLQSIMGRDFGHTLNKDVPSHFYGPHPGGLPEMLTLFSGG